MRKLFILSCVFALCGSLEMKSSPRSVRVTELIVVDDAKKGNADLSEVIKIAAPVAFEYVVTLNTLDTVIVSESSPVFEIVKATNFIEVSGEVTTLRDTGDILSFSYSLPKKQKNLLRSEKIYLTNCCIRQCISRTVATV